MTRKTHKFSIRLPWFQRWATYAVLAVVTVSGLAWLILHDVLQWSWMGVEHVLLVTHGGAAALSLVVVGGLLPLHVRLALHIQRNVWSGAITLGLMGALGVTGWLLYYGGEEWRDAVRWLHIAVGAATAIALPTHVWIGRRRKARSLRVSWATLSADRTE